MSVACAPWLWHASVSSDRSEIVWGDWTPLELLFAGVRGLNLLRRAAPRKFESRRQSLPQPAAGCEFVKHSGRQDTVRTFYRRCPGL